LIVIIDSLKKIKENLDKMPKLIEAMRKAYLLERRKQKKGWDLFWTTPKRKTYNEPLAFAKKKTLGNSEQNQQSSHKAKENDRKVQKDNRKQQNKEISSQSSNSDN